MSAALRVLVSFGVVSAVACAPLRMSPVNAFAPSHRMGGTGRPTRDASALGGRTLGVVPMPPELTRAIERRLTDLEQRGGVCSRYAAVLERSYRSGRITIRPYMWRVDGHLVSGQAGPNGEMVLAREIDSLNVGVRTVDDVLWTVEHEAVHIALDIASGNALQEDRADRYVQACRSRESDD